jgi:hypothetical protein|uniref:Uncharacterized protein n=1 Tax=viral metagenome TaxID=1070528 RepID=A0A6C0DR34_9ZZZZ
MSYPIVAEIWNSFQVSLQIQSKRLVEDIAKHQGQDPKALWAKVSPLLHTPLVDVDLPDPVPTFCSYPMQHADGAIYLRCRAPCLLGFSKCHKHIHVTPPHDLSNHIVKRWIDSTTNKSYFLDASDRILDINGIPVGEHVDGDAYLWDHIE